MPQQERQLLECVREVLFFEWDPIGVNEYPQCRDEYDSYAPGICRLLREGADPYRLAAHLTQLMRENMGLSRIDEGRNGEVAGRLIEVYRTLFGPDSGGA